jgi:hypothetical protein
MTLAREFIPTLNRRYTSHIDIGPHSQNSPERQAAIFGKLVNPQRRSHGLARKAGAGKSRQSQTNVFAFRTERGVGRRRTESGRRLGPWYSVSG